MITLAPAIAMRKKRNARMMEGNYKGRGWAEKDYAQSMKILEEMSYDCYTMPKQALEKNPQVPQLAVDYRELVTQPKATIEKVYSALGLVLSDEYKAVLAEKDSQVRQHKTKHSYSAEEFGIDTARMRQELEEFYAKYQWE